MSYFIKTYLEPTLSPIINLDSFKNIKKDKLGSWLSYAPTKLDGISMRLIYGSHSLAATNIFLQKNNDNISSFWAGQFPTCCGLAEFYGLSIYPNTYKEVLTIMKLLTHCAGYSKALLTHTRNNEFLEYILGSDNNAKCISEFYNRRSGNYVKIVEISP